jgi:UDP-N-acetylglucosamine:LPS N-acetylglucosamine transferase
VKQLPELRLVVVAGPRVDVDDLTLPAGEVVVLGYLPDLDQHLAACDIAVVQGGLTTCMELTANRRPFLYFPLANHFEQQRHVAYRLDRYRAGRRMQLAEVGPEELAEALVAELGRTLDYLPVESGGAARAAALLAELI